MNLRKTTFSATRWIVISAIVRASVQLLQTAVLARLLLPGDFGLMAMAGVATTVAALFADLGLSSALMHYAQPDRRTLSTLYWLNLGVACILAALFAVASWPLSNAYGQPELIFVLSWLSLSFPLGALGQPFRVLAEKSLRFRLLAENEIIAAILGFLVALMLAVAGNGVYALAMASLVIAGTSSLLAWCRLSEGVRPGWYFSPALAKPYLAFGLHRVGDGFWNTMLTQSDVFFAGLVANPSLVAHYTMTREQCLRIANAVINPVITRVSLPIMTQLQHERAVLRLIYLKTLRITASFNFPIYAFLAIFSEDFVALLLGSQWRDAALYMRIFAIWGLIRSTGNPSGSLIYAVGMTKRAHIWNMVLFFLIAPLLWLSAKLGGLHSLAWTLLIWQACVFFLAWRFLIFPACGASFTSYCVSIAAPFLITIIAAGTAGICIQTVPIAAYRLPLGALLFFALYLILSKRYNFEWWDAMRLLLAPLSKLRGRSL